MSALYPPKAKLHRALVKSRLVLRRLARTRTASAAAQFGKALRADITDLGEYVSRRPAPNLVQLDWKQQATRAATKLRSFTGWRWLPPAACVGMLLVAAGTLVWTLHDLPFAQVLKAGAERVILLETADGKPLVRKGPFRAPDKSLKEFPPHLIDAVISIEDRRFYAHNGLDPRGLLRALGRNIREGEVVEGR